MAKYRIKPIKHLLKNNKFAKSGEIVDGSQFINLQLSLEGGYCELVEEEATSKKVNSKQILGDAGDAGDAGDEPTEIELEIKKIKKFSKDELKAFCVENDIDYDNKLNKDDLKAFIIDILENPVEDEETEEE